MKTGLYVHVPLCETKCGYCDFYSVPMQGQRPGLLVNALIAELDRRQAVIPGPFEAVFVGGGTPTVLPAADLARLFGRLAQVARDHDVAEFTTEANPATVDADKVALLVRCGVNRMSFGAQSFHASELERLERLHRPEEIAPSVGLARQGGIPRINLDLMFGIPGQTAASWRESLTRAVDLGVDHVACYGLTYESGTPMTERVRQGLLSPCDPDVEADLYALAIEFLEARGFRQYEISNFARPGCECRQNLVYWNNWPYLGIGPSAASYVDGARFKNVADIDNYIADIARNGRAWHQEERLQGLALAGETAMLQLRLNRGIEIAEFTRATGLDPLRVYEGQIAAQVHSGLLEVTPTHIRLTPKGRPLADHVIRELIFTPPTTDG